VIEKLDWHGKLLQRAARGETRAHVCADLGIEVNKDCLAALRATYETGGCTWRALRDDGHHGRAYQMNSTIRDWPYGQERQDEHARVPASAREIQEKLGIKVSDGHFDYLLRQRGLAAPLEQPFEPPPGEETSEDLLARTASWGNRELFPWKRKASDRDDPVR
jgi:hypothetical protein